MKMENNHIRQASMDPNVRFLDHWSDDKLIYYPVGKGERVLSEENLPLQYTSMSMSEIQFLPCKNLLEYQPQSKFLKAHWPL